MATSWHYIVPLWGDPMVNPWIPLLPRPVMQGFDVFFAVRLKKLLTKQLNCPRFETQCHPCDDNVLLTHWWRDKMVAIFQTTFSYAFSWMKMNDIRLKFHWSFFPKVAINNFPALVQIMAWRRPGDKPLSEPMMVVLPTHICVTRPQWVNESNGTYNLQYKYFDAYTTTYFIWSNSRLHGNNYTYIQPFSVWRFLKWWHIADHSCGETMAISTAKVLFLQVVVIGNARHFWRRYVTPEGARTHLFHILKNTWKYDANARSRLHR